MRYVLVHARAVEHCDDTMLPRIGIMRALYPGETAPTPRKKRAKKFRIVRTTSTTELSRLDAAVWLKSNVSRVSPCGTVF